MRVAFDTSVLVAALLENHTHHQRALIWWKSVVAGDLEGVFSLHALAETWSVLTRLPLKPRLSGSEALQVLERLQQAFTTIALPQELYDAALRRSATSKLSSGAVFDALHVVAAEAAEADLILTFNVKHFLPLTTSASPLLLAPPDPPSLEFKRSSPPAPGAGPE